MIAIGTDILKVDRVDAVVERLGDRFVQRILTPAEQLEYKQSQQPNRLLAKRAARAAAEAEGNNGYASPVTPASIGSPFTSDYYGGHRLGRAREAACGGGGDDEHGGDEQHADYLDGDGNRDRQQPQLHRFA